MHLGNDACRTFLVVFENHGARLCQISHCSNQMPLNIHMMKRNDVRFFRPTLRIEFWWNIWNVEILDDYAPLNVLNFYLFMMMPLVRCIQFIHFMCGLFESRKTMKLIITFGFGLRVRSRHFYNNDSCILCCKFNWFVKWPLFRCIILESALRDQLFWWYTSLHNSHTKLNYFIPWMHNKSEVFMLPIYVWFLKNRIGYNRHRLSSNRKIEPVRST